MLGISRLLTVFVVGRIAKTGSHEKDGRHCEFFMFYDSNFYVHRLFYQEIDAYVSKLLHYIFQAMPIPPYV